MKKLQNDLDLLRDQGVYRQLVCHSQGIDFSSNDYLGLSRSEKIRRLLIEALQAGVPLGATGSRLLRGNREQNERVEVFLADQYRAESALLFSSGYNANLAVLSALGNEDCEFFSDALNHASLVDGMKLSKARKSIFRHNDLEDLRRKLSVSKSSRRLLVTESVFSMDGDLAPLEELIAVAREFDAWLVVDEAHATGVFGPKGLGRLEEFDTSDLNLVAIHTCGKALGAQGAFVLAKKSVRDFLVNKARPFVFSTALAPLSALQIEAAVRVLEEMQADRFRLQEMARGFREAVRNYCEIGPSTSQIVPILLRSNEKAMQAAAVLQERGLDVRPIRSPTVAPGTERLRISLKSFHRESDLALLQQELQKVVRL